MSYGNAAKRPHYAYGLRIVCHVKKSKADEPNGAGSQRKRKEFLFEIFGTEVS